MAIMAAESRKRGFGLGAVFAVCAVLASGVAWARTTVEESAGAFRDWSATCRYDFAGGH